jgi:hypothetical protein
MNSIWLIPFILILIILYLTRVHEFFVVIPKEWTDRKDLYMMSLYDFISDPRTNLAYFKTIPARTPTDTISSSNIISNPSSQITDGVTFNIDLDGLKAIFNEKLSANGLNPANYNYDFLNIRELASGGESGYTYQDYLEHYEQRIYFFARQDIAINGPKNLPQSQLSRAQRLWPQISQLYMQFPQPPRPAP